MALGWGPTSPCDQHVSVLPCVVFRRKARANSLDLSPAEGRKIESNGNDDADADDHDYYSRGCAHAVARSNPKLMAASMMTAF